MILGFGRISAACDACCESSLLRTRSSSAKNAQADQQQLLYATSSMGVFFHLSSDPKIPLFPHPNYLSAANGYILERIFNNFFIKFEAALLDEPTRLTLAL